MQLRLDIKNTSNALSEEKITSLCSEAEAALETLWNGTGRGSDFLGWLTLADGLNADELDAIHSASRRIQADSDALIVIGIGGSYLGARAALDFIKSPNYNHLPKNTPDIYFAGNGLSADATNEIIQMLGNRDFSVNVISKSGTTTEPAVAFRIFKDLLEKKYGRENAAKRIYATTDASRGALKKLADKEGYTCFVIPDDVGGRYSVFTPVGLLPLSAAGIDISSMLSGAKAAFVAGRLSDPKKNLSLQYAAVRNGLLRKGINTEIFAAFEPALRYTGEWWKQLFGESEGKEGRGLFPASVDLTADLHSMGQYIQQGQRVLMETFVKVEKSGSALAVPNDGENSDSLNFLSGRELTWANHQALVATSIAHMDGGVPNILVTIPDRSERSFGELAAFFEIACGISGYMLGVNPFDQPGVEAYKVNMFALLGKPGYEKERADIEKKI